MGAFIHNAYASNVPDFVPVGSTYEAEITVNVDDIFTGETFKWKLKIFDMFGFLLDTQELVNPPGAGKDQQQWKFKVKLKKTEKGSKLVKIVVELYKLQKPSVDKPFKENFTDSDTVSFITTGVSFGDIAPIEPLPFPFFPLKEDKKKSGIVIAVLVTAGVGLWALLR